MKTKKQLTHWFLVIIIGVALGLALQFVRAWTEPTTAPPGGNVGAPINTSATAQTKAGAIYSNDKIGAPKLCIGTDCRDAWPSGGTPAPAPAPPCLCFNPAAYCGSLTTFSFDSYGPYYYICSDGAWVIW